MTVQFHLSLEALSNIVHDEHKCRWPKVCSFFSPCNAARRQWQWQWHCLEITQVYRHPTSSDNPSFDADVSSYSDCLGASISPTSKD